MLGIGDFSRMTYLGVKQRDFRDGHRLLDAVIAALRTTRETIWPPAGSPARWL